MWTISYALLPQPTQFRFRRAGSDGAKSTISMHLTPAHDMYMYTRTFQRIFPGSGKHIAGFPLPLCPEIVGAPASLDSPNMDVLFFLPFQSLFEKLIF